MEHVLLKAATTVATEEGTFEAIISTASEDRDGDIVEPSALMKALDKWANIGKLVPLVYSHRDPATGQSIVVGHVDPGSARIEGNSVITKGAVDRSTDRGAETWRLVKSGTLSFSYGFLVPEGGAKRRAGKGKGFHIIDLDLFEISTVPVGPANNETRVLGWKSVEDANQFTMELKALREQVSEMAGMLQELKKVDEVPRVPQARGTDPLRDEAQRTARKIAAGGLDQIPPSPQAQEKARPDTDPDRLKAESRSLMLQVLSGSNS